MLHLAFCYWFSTTWLSGGTMFSMAKKKKAQGATPALRVLEEHSISHSVSTFEGGTDHFGDHAAAALDVEPGRIFKTLVVELKPKRLAVVCVPVTHQLSLKKAAAALCVPKAQMADQDEAARSSGYIPGGISPIGQKRPLDTVIDDSALDHSTIFVSGGRRGLDIELAPADLAFVTGASFADVKA